MQRGEYERARVVALLKNRGEHLFPRKFVHHIHGAFAVNVAEAETYAVGEARLGHCIVHHLVVEAHPEALEITQE